MKTYTFSNGETRLESQMRNDVDFKTQCILWGCFDKATGEPLLFVISETTEQEMKIERQRLSEIENEYKQICEKNNRISRGNERIAKATNINEFMNAYL